jgi:hypothetical protein
MARKAARALACLAIAAAAATAGCTWAETKHDYPPSMYQQSSGHDHGHDHAHGR